MGDSLPSAPALARAIAPCAAAVARDISLTGELIHSNGKHTGRKSRIFILLLHPDQFPEMFRCTTSQTRTLSIKGEAAARCQRPQTAAPAAVLR